MSTLTDILSSLHIPFRLPGQDHHVNNNWIGLPCPWCSSSKFHLAINILDGRCNCWRCGRHSATEALSLLGHISTKDAARHLAKVQRFHTTREPERERGTLKQPPGIQHPLPIPHRNYLKGRGLDPDEIERLWGIGGIPQASRLQWRLYIPIYDVTGTEVSWTTRAIAPNHPLRYISASNDEEVVPHKDLLYGAHLARSVVVVVEGPVDAWVIGPGAVATCGVGYSAAQISALAEYPLRVVCFDSEDMAQRRAEELCRQLALFGGSTVQATLETGKDAGVADPAEVQELRNYFLD